mgnify:CR=1 FL=1
MWMPKWLWERYEILRLRLGINTIFKFNDAKALFSYDSNEMVYKTLNKLEKLKIIEVKRAKKDSREKLYKIVLDLKDLPFQNLTIPSNKAPEPNLYSLTGSMNVYGTTSATNLAREFENIYNKEGLNQITIVKEKPAKNTNELLIDLVKEFKSPEPILKLLNNKIDFNIVITNLNSFERRYLGALLEILNKKNLNKIKNKLYNLTKNDNREFSIYPRKVRRIPKKYLKIAKKWRIHLNIDEVDLNEL